MTHRELPIPTTVKQSPRAEELLRVWVKADNNIDLALVPGFPDPGVWGILLVDIAQHVASAYADQAGSAANRQEILGVIKQSFDAEWSRPTAGVAMSRIKR